VSLHAFCSRGPVVRTPIVTEPITGSPKEGTESTIYGTGFDRLKRAAAPIHVRVGDYLAEEVVIVDDRTITLISPPGFGGDREILLSLPFV
jgi:hypothetical protein